MNENKAISLLKQQRDQYYRELTNLTAQAEGVKKAMDIIKAKVEALDSAIELVSDFQPPA
jgi:uncharacterized coiled-coil DUF342 family protein